MDKISVIVPVSNSQKYLTQCLDSIIYDMPMNQIL